MPQFEYKLVVRTVRLTGFFFAAYHKLFRRLSVNRFTGMRSVSDRASNPRCPQYIQFVGIEQHFCFNTLRHFAV